MKPPGDFSERMLHVYTMIGWVNRLLEEEGIHRWSIYPSRGADDSICICVIMSMYRADHHVTGYQSINSGMVFDATTTPEDVKLRLRSAFQELREFIEEEGAEITISPRKGSTEEWSKL